MKKLLTSFAYAVTSLAATFSLAMPLLAPATVQAQTASALPSGFCYTFNRNLGEGHTLSSADANALEEVLSAQGLWSSGTPITTYTDAVASAVVGFQQKYSAQILAPYGLSYGTGYIGTATRAELNSLYGCSSSTNPTIPTYPTNPVNSTSCPAGYVCTPINQNPTPVCPPQYTCVPVTTTITNPTSPITPTTGNSSPTPGFVWTSSDPASPTSVQGQLQAQGETWTEVPGTITAGSYVEDTLEGRLNQPEGRGAIGQVTYTGESGGQQYATVNFGNGWIVNIDFNELSLVTVSGGGSNPQTFSITSPSAGAVWQVGQTYTIAWSGTDTANPTNLPEQVFLVGGALGNTGSLPIANNIPVGTQSFTWTIPSTVQPGTTYQIGVGANVKGGSGGQSQPFTIVSAASTTPQPSVTVLSPGGGQTLSFGTPITITWTTTGITGGVLGLYLQNTSGVDCSIGSPNALADSITLTLQANQSCPGNPYLPNLIPGQYKVSIDASPATGIEDTGGNGSYFTLTNSSNQQSPVPGPVTAINHSQNPATAQGLIYVSWPNQGSGYTYTVTASPSFPGGVETTTKPQLNMGCYGPGSMYCFNGGGPFPANGPYTFTVTATGSNGTFTIGMSNAETVSPVSTTPVAPQISISGTPTIVKNNVTSSGSGTTTYQYTATFNVQLQAGSNSLSIALPNSSSPAVENTSAYIQVMKNGAPDSTNDGAIVSYSTPSGATVSADGTYFTVAANQVVTMPVTVSFTIPNAGSNTYGVQLNGVGYSSGSQNNQIYTIFGATTAFTLVPIGGIMTASAMNALEQWLAHP